jgi:hypothetical protein
MRSLVIISAAVHGCDLLPQISSGHETYTIGTASFMPIFSCILDQDVATFIVGDFFRICPTCLLLRVCAGTAGSQNRVNAPECAGMTVLKCQILQESCRESCALFAILAPAPAPASRESLEFLPAERGNLACRIPGQSP